MPAQAGLDYRSSVPDELSAAQRRELHLRLLGSGVIISESGLGCLSTVMDAAEVSEFVDAIEASATAMP